MREMKDSGIEWIGKIPKEWSIVKFKCLHNGLNTGEAIDKEYWESDAGLNAFYTAGLTPIRTGYSNFPTWKETRENDLLLARNGTPYVYLPVSKAYYTDHIIRAAMSSLVNRRFIRYCLQQSIASIAVDSVSIPTWSATLWNNQILTWPSVIEQERIAAFLDAECAEIDAVLEKTRASIEEYKKLKQAVITQAVTKGIRGDRPMKDSGIEWIGDIPAEWDVVRIKNLFDYRNERNFKPLEEVNLISLYTDKGVVQHCDLDETTGNKASNADGYKLVYENDIVVNIILCWMGAVGRSAYNGVTSPAYDVYKPLHDTNSKYYHYLFRTSQFNGECYRYGRGIMLMRWRTYSTEFRAISVPLPPEDEQERIVEFLDKKLDDVDRLIGNVQTQIEKLKAYKQSLITEVVTKGLDSTVPMKNSGVEWIGEIPEKWSVVPLKSKFSFGKGLPITKDDLVEEGIPVISYGQIHAKWNTGVTTHENLLRYVNESYLESNSSALVKKGDLIMADTSEDRDGCGNCAYIDIDETVFAGYHTIILNALNSENNKYFAYLFLTDNWRSQIRKAVSGVKLFSISRRILGCVSVLVPNNAEDIVNYLDAKCAYIDRLIAIKQAKIEKLEQYKRSLIYEYVTGKKEVS